jgi:hypothetical protein
LLPRHLADAAVRILSHLHHAHELHPPIGAHALAAATIAIAMLPPRILVI